jgi:hypothetical protein
MYGPDPVPAIAAVELVLPQAQRLLGPAPLIEYQPDPYTGEIVPIMLVTDNGGPFQSFRFSALITSRPELRHVRTRVRSLGQNDVRACLRLTRVRAALPRASDDPLDLVRETEAFRVELNTVRPHEALARTVPPTSMSAWPTWRSPPLKRPNPANLLTRDIGCRGDGMAGQTGGLGRVRRGPAAGLRVPRAPQARRRGQARQAARGPRDPHPGGAPPSVWTSAIGRSSACLAISGSSRPIGSGRGYRTSTTLDLDLVD